MGWPVFSRIGRVLVARVDGADVQALVGLGLMGYGIGLLSVPWALITVGAVFVLAGFGREIGAVIALARGSGVREESRR